MKQQPKLTVSVVQGLEACDGELVRATEQDSERLLRARMQLPSVNGATDTSWGGERGRSAQGGSVQHVAFVVESEEEGGRKTRTAIEWERTDTATGWSWVAWLGQISNLDGSSSDFCRHVQGCSSERALTLPPSVDSQPGSWP